MFQIVLGLVAYALLYAGIQFLLPGGHLNNDQNCTTISDQELAELKEQKQAKKADKTKASSSITESSDGSIKGKTSYTKRINSPPFKLDLKAPKGVKLKSSNKRVVVVRDNGMVYPNDVGKATITASTKGQTFKISIKINKRISKPTIGQASGTISGGGSMNTTKWKYGGPSAATHWNYVFRYKNPERAEKAADLMLAAIKTGKVGYKVGPPSLTFTEELRKKNWDPSKINKRVYTACTQAVLTIVQASGYRRNAGDKWVYAETPGTVTKLRNTGKFYELTSSDYTTKYYKLRRGDILIDADPWNCPNRCNRHAVMVVS